MKNILFISILCLLASCKPDKATIDPVIASPEKDVPKIIEVTNPSFHTNWGIEVDYTKLEETKDFCQFIDSKAIIQDLGLPSNTITESIDQTTYMYKSCHWSWANETNEKQRIVCKIKRKSTTTDLENTLLEWDRMVLAYKSGDYPDQVIEQVDLGHNVLAFWWEDSLMLNVFVDKEKHFYIKQDTKSENMGFKELQLSKERSVKLAKKVLALVAKK